MDYMFALNYFYPVVLTFTIIVLVKSWRKSIRNEFRDEEKPSPWLTIFGALFTTVAPLIGFIRYNKFGSGTPFSDEHVLVIKILVVVSALCYWLSRFGKNDFSPFVNLLIRAGLLQGIILDIVVTIHFGGYMLLGLMFPVMGFELLAPPIAMTFILYELQCNLKSPQRKALPESSPGKSAMLQVGLLVLLIVVEQTVLLPIGSHWDSLVKVFTESQGFLFSNNSRFFSRLF
jgi:hypothetical protein